MEPGRTINDAAEALMGPLDEQIDARREVGQSEAGFRVLALLRRGAETLRGQLAYKSLIIYLLWALGLGLVLASYLDWNSVHLTGFIPVDVRPKISADYSARPEFPEHERAGAEPIPRWVRTDLK
jgi:hypothetical protein